MSFPSTKTGWPLWNHLRSYKSLPSSILISTGGLFSWLAKADEFGLFEINPRFDVTVGAPKQKQKKN